MIEYRFCLTTVANVNAQLVIPGIHTQLDIAFVAHGYIFTGMIRYIGRKYRSLLSKKH